MELKDLIPATPYTTVTAASGKTYDVPWNHSTALYAQAGSLDDASSPLAALQSCTYAGLDRYDTPTFDLTFYVRRNTVQEIAYEHFITGHGPKPSFSFDEHGVTISLQGYSVCNDGRENCILETVPAFAALDEDEQDSIRDDHYCVGRIFDVVAAVWERGHIEEWETAAANTIAAQRNRGVIYADNAVDAMQEAESSGTDGWYELYSAQHTDESGAEWLAMISEHED